MSSGRSYPKYHLYVNGSLTWTLKGFLYRRDVSLRLVGTAKSSVSEYGSPCSIVQVQI